jgi:CubicO group peptidase (beta-lactamase class C family)
VIKATLLGIIGAFSVVIPRVEAETRIQPRFNVGEFIQIRGSSNHELTEHANPRVLFRSKIIRNSNLTEKARHFLKNSPATTALLLIDRGHIVFEAYQGLGNENREFYSMSIGKSLSSMAIGKALCDGKFKSLDQKAGDIAPELDANNLGKSTLKQLLTMTSGAYVSKHAGQPQFNGGIGIRRKTGKPYERTMFWPIRLGQISIPDVLWGKEWEKVKDKAPHLPGAAFIYKAADTLALSVLIERTTNMSLAQYFEKKIWRQIRSAGTAHWESDRDGTTVSASGFQTSLRDWGRLALWILEEHKKSGCFGNYLRTATSKQVSTNKPSEKYKKRFRGYGYQWWTNNILAPGFWGVGYAGQFLGINPKTQKIILKFSYATSGKSNRELFEFFNGWNSGVEQSN